MAIIEKLDEHVIYENSMPQLCSRQAVFPGLVKLPCGELLAVFEIGEAFESVDAQPYISRSRDSGKNWQLQGPLWDESGYGFPVSQYVKPTVLSDGSIIAVGYNFHRRDSELPIGNAETGGLLDGDNIVSFSNDQGKTWSVPKKIEHGFPEIIETSGPCLELSNSDLIAFGPPFKMHDGSNPNGQIGYILRSSDKGKTWDGSTKYFDTSPKQISPSESRGCEMQPGRVVIIVWAFEMAANKHHTNHVVVSHDYGRSWSAPIDTCHKGQASNIMYLGGEKLLSIHAHRVGDAGLYARLIDFTDDKWNMLDELKLWSNVKAQDESASLIDQYAGLRFGQPSLLQLDNNEILATVWCVEDCMYKIKIHRLKLNL